MWWFIGGMNYESTAKLSSTPKAICVSPQKPHVKTEIFWKPLSSNELRHIIVHSTYISTSSLINSLILNLT